MQTHDHYQQRKSGDYRKAGPSKLHYFSALWLLTTVLLFAACTKDKKEPACAQGVAPKGKLTKDQGKFEYKTSGGGIIRYSSDFGGLEILHDDYPGFKVNWWGGGTYVNGIPKISGNHENLNGKHIKDRLGSARSFIFPDGAKVTLVAASDTLPIITVTIYEAGECHRISASCFTLEFSTTNDAALVQQLDNAEADGETSTIEFITNGLLWLNIYREDTPGSKVNGRVQLGELDRSNPNRVVDYYDDPRLGHT